MNKKIIRVSDAIPEMPLSFDRTVEQTLNKVCTGRNEKTARSADAKISDRWTPQSGNARIGKTKQRLSRILAVSCAAVLVLGVFAVGGIVLKNNLFGRSEPIPMAQDETPNARVPAIMHNGELYVLYGEPADVRAPGEGETIEYVASIVPSSEWPTEDGQANFGEVGTPYAVTKDGFIAQINGEWRLFEAEESGNGDALCLFFDGCLHYAPYENWIWSDQDDGLAADGRSFVYQMDEIKDMIQTIHNPARLAVTAGDGVNLEPQVKIYDEALNTVAFGADISTVCTLDPGMYYVTQRVSRREEGRNAGYECVVRVVIGKETEHVTYSAALTDLLQKEDPEANVEIRITGLDYGDALESAFVYRGKTLTEYRNQPVLRAYTEAYDAWYFDEYPAIDEQNRDTPGWEKHDPMSLFDVSWRERHSEAEIQAYELAREAYINARNAFIEWQESEAGREALQTIYRQECDRLNACGFSLQVSAENKIEGTATVGLLRSFPAKDGYQYWITLVDDSSPIDE